MARECLNAIELDSAHSLEPFCLGFFEYEANLGVGICWPSTERLSTTEVMCPSREGFDEGKYLQRECLQDGTWANVSGIFYGCFSNNALEGIMKINIDESSEEEIKFVRETIIGARILEIIGYVLSFVSLLIALFIFSYFRSLKCVRTSIHKQMFLAMSLRLLLDILFYIDREVMYSDPNEAQKIRNTPILCKTFEFFREYTRLVVFNWMFIEGYYLNQVTTSSDTFRPPNYKFCITLGWTLPLIPVITWCVTMAYTNKEKCWFGYVNLITYWIIDAPRNIVLFVNLLFLVNIITVLVTKLKESKTSEIEQVRKAVRAAIFLIPLFGVANLLFLIDNEPSPTDHRIIIGLYWYGLLFVVSFQGFALAVIYCFANTEVRTVIYRKYKTWIQIRSLHRHITNSSKKNGNQQIRMETQPDQSTTVDII